jgi:hypothetical protein
MIDTFVKNQKTTFTWREKASPLPPLEVNSSGSTLTPGRGLIAPGLMMDFLRVHHDYSRAR